MTVETKYHIKQNSIRKIDLNIGRDIRDEDGGIISTIDKNAKIGYCIFNGKVRVLIFSLFKG